MCHELKRLKNPGLQDPSEINWDNLNNIRREASSYFTNKNMAYLKDKINELVTDSKNKNRDPCGGINEFNRSYHPRSNLLNDKNDDLLAESHNILNKKVIPINRQWRPIGL
jgi:hypothetical protein